VSPAFYSITMDNTIVQTADDLFRPVMESSIVLASHYCKKCDRDCVTPMDLNYAMKFCARYVLGKQIGTLYPEIYEDEDDEDDEEFDVIDDEDDTPFSRYSGDDEMMNKVNECWDTWDQWEPQDPMAQMLKRAIDSKN